MNRRARRKDANQNAIADRLEARGCVVHDCSAFGDGFPDLLVYDPAAARLFLVEVKSTALAALTDYERAFFAKFAGAPLFVARRPDDADDILARL